MKTEQLDALARLRQKFLIPANIKAGFVDAGAMAIDHQTTDTERMIRFTATTNATDMDEEVIDPAGGDWSFFDSAGQKKMFIDHKYESEYGIGLVRAKSPYMNNGRQAGWKMSAHIYKGLRSIHADDFWTRSQQGPVGISIGYLTIKASGLTAAEKKVFPNAQTIVREWKALEVSGTLIACNPECYTDPIDGSKSAISVKPTIVQLPWVQVRC